MKDSLKVDERWSKRASRSASPTWAYVRKAYWMLRLKGMRRNLSEKFNITLGKVCICTL